MRAIDYFDRGHDRDPSRLAIIDTESGLKLTFAEVKELSERIAAARGARMLLAVVVASIVVVACQPGTASTPSGGRGRFATTVPRT